MTPDEIRALYVETLARNSYERWRSHHNRAVQEDGNGILVAAFDDVPDGDFPKETHHGSASVAVDALAAAGLLPTEALWAVTGTETELPDDPYEFLDDDNLFSREDAEHKRDRYYPGNGRIAVSYRTEWKEVTE